MKKTFLLILTSICSTATATDPLLFCHYRYDVDSWRLQNFSTYEKPPAEPGKRKFLSSTSFREQSLCIWEYLPLIEGGLALEFTVWDGDYCVAPKNGHMVAHSLQQVPRGVGAGIATLFPLMDSVEPYWGMATYLYLLTEEDKAEAKKGKTHLKQICESLTPKY